MGFLVLHWFGVQAQSDFLFHTSKTVGKACQEGKAGKKRGLLQQTSNIKGETYCEGLVEKLFQVIPGKGFRRISNDVGRENQTGYGYNKQGV